MKEGMKEGKGKERKGKERKEKERKGKERKGKERKGKERNEKERKGKGKERTGKERKGKEMKGKKRKGKERKGKERKEKERKGKQDGKERTSVIWGSGPGVGRRRRSSPVPLLSRCVLPGALGLALGPCSLVKTLFSSTFLARIWLEFWPDFGRGFPLAGGPLGPP